VTNAAGGGLEGMEVGSIMVIEDHMTWANKSCLPTIFNDPRMIGPMNFKSSWSHNKQLIELAKKIG
jgi:purine nucleoside phosphorylase